MIFTSSELRKSHKEALVQLRQASLSPFNRLHSINEDAQFVQKVRHAYRDSNFPLVPNLRCGAWYCCPSITSEYVAYFKSSDGHFNNWSFNLRRPNLHLLPAIVEHKGIILVDSTRSGKRIPDALSKTVPIWCSVVNRAVQLRHPRGGQLYRSSDESDSVGTVGKGSGRAGVSSEKSEKSAHDDGTLYSPPQCVSPQEHEQIEKRIDGWAKDLCKSTYELPDLQKPLRPIWITPSTNSYPFSSTIDTNSDAPFYPIICVSASRVVEEGLDRRNNGYYSYVQGSGDDHESWSERLTPRLFWKHKEQLLQCAPDKLYEEIQRIVQETKADLSATSERSNSDVTLKTLLQNAVPISRVKGKLLLVEGTWTEFARPQETTMSTDPDTIAHGDNIALLFVTLPHNGEVLSQQSPVAQSADNTDNENPKFPPQLTIVIPSEKKSNIQRDAFISALAPSLNFIGEQLKAQRKVCVVFDESTRDGAIGIMVAALQRWYADDGNDTSQLKEGDDCKRQPTPSKDTIRARLQWIIASYPAANPSRATLKRINEHFMTESKFREGGVSTLRGSEHHTKTL